jgi:tRNA-(ms[2]io[6]A)-hydroxylase
MTKTTKKLSEEELKKTVLGLNLPTDPRWTDLVRMNIGDILTDHAWAEQKAASSCISMIIQFSDYQEVVEVLSPVVTEEWGHFRMVLREMEKRGFRLGPHRSDAYAVKLRSIEKKGGSREQQLVEKCLLNALIEARSAERFKLLWKNIPDVELQEFYYNLMISEAGHYTNFLSLAKNYMPEAYVMDRWQEYLLAEAEIIRELGVRGDRMH